MLVNMHSSIVPLVKLTLLILALNRFDSIDCANVIPDKLYSSTRLFLAKDRVTDDLKHYQVEEYVNLKANKSSILVRQHWRDEKTQIYYNQIGRNELIAERKFLVFDVESNTCTDEISIGYWELAILRRVAIILYTSSVPVQQRFVDIAIGPSVLLYAIENTLDEFKYKETKLANSRLTYIDVFERRIQIEALDDFSELDIKVSVKSRASTIRTAKAVGGGDAQRADQTLGEAVKMDQNQLEIVSVVACKVLDAESDDDGGDSPKASGKVDEHASAKSTKHIPGSLACGGTERVLFHIDYNLIEEYSLSSLTGRRIYEQHDYDFHREPFVQPVGIGCWGAKLVPWQKTFSRPSLQFSAEYSSNNGSRGLNYVALDGYSNVFRLDRMGRKSVYDLSSRLSYHIGEFSSAHDANPAEEDVSMGKCLTLKISEETLEPQRAMDRLLGVNRVAETRHLGTKMIDHVQYEVFEVNLNYIPKLGFNLPILLQPLRYAAETDFYAKKFFFVTFYVHEYPNLVKQSARSQDGAQEQAAVYSVPKFVELWEFSQTTRTRRLVNRLVFTQFSWSLDVMPSNDPDTQLHLDNLFSIRQCHQTRATQSELDFYISPFSSTRSTITAQQLAGLGASLSTVEEVLHERLTTILGISRLNIDQLEARLLSSGQLAVKSRIVELAQGIEYLIPQGLLRLSDKLFDANIESIQHVYSGRHSLDDCKLDSAGWPKANFMAYCSRLTICVILKQDEDWAKELAKRLESQTAAESSSVASSWLKELKEAPDLCQVYTFSYLDIFDQHELKTIKMVEENEYKIAGTRFNFDYKYVVDEASQRLAPATYTGYGLVSHLRMLDPIGAKWGIGAQSMVGLSYTTGRDEPLAFNMNRRISLSDSTDTFGHCQLACQMDDFCGSFSVCLRNKRQRTRAANSNPNQPDDCVLSSMRFTAARLAQLSSLARKSKKGAKGAAQKFEMKYTGEQLSQVLVMHHDADCSLHSKDFLSEYVSIFEYLPSAFAKPDNPKSSAKSLQEQLIPTSSTSDSPTAVEHKALTLAECAGLSFDKHLDADVSSSSKFTYCPIERLCFLTDQLIELGERNIDGKFCRVYDRNYQRYYNEKPMTHMRISYENLNSNSLLNTNRQEAQDDKQQLIDWLGDDLRKFSMAKTFWGLNSEECARECNLHRSYCLAFDSCKQTGKKLCLLYSIRSPKSSPHLPLLAIEAQLHAEIKQNPASSFKFKSVRLSRSEFCDHYWLKPSYFSIRLHQFLANESDDSKVLGQDKTSAVEEKRDQLVESIEKKVEQADEEKSKAEYSAVEQQSIDQSLGGQADGSKARGGGVRFSMLLIGLLVGCVLTLFKSQISDAAESLYQFYLMRRGAAANAPDSLSQLVLNDQM